MRCVTPSGAPQRPSGVQLLPPRPAYQGEASLGPGTGEAEQTRKSPVRHLQPVMPQEPIPPSERSSLIASLAVRESYRDAYWRNSDPIVRDRLLWRAQSMRHTVHLLPGERILELGCGGGLFTEALNRVVRGENPITAVTFQSARAEPSAALPPAVEHLRLDAFPGPLAGRRFDCIVGLDLLDRSTASELLQHVHHLLHPGGEIVFYESNPWNPVHKLRWAISQVLGRGDPRLLMNRPGLYELLSEIGFVRIYAVYNDFVFAPLTRSLIWLLRPLSTLLENTPAVQRMAGSILVHGQKPPSGLKPVTAPFPAHPSLTRAVSVVIPCRNEEPNVEPLVRRILDLYGPYVYEIITVNDGSTDRTAEIMKAMSVADDRIRVIHRPPPHGVGHAIAEGLRAARGRYVLMMDCDFQHLLPEFRDLFDAAAHGWDVVVGSRFSRHSVLLNYPFFKIVANRAFHLCARLLFWRRFRDLTNNLKIMKREVVRDLCLRQPGFAVNAETGLQPLLLGYAVREVPISWINRTPAMGMSSFRLLRVGGGYLSVLYQLWVGRVFKAGPYRKLQPTSHATSVQTLQASREVKGI
jgi:dolichol-phosphate mannosyltransferase